MRPASTTDDERYLANLQSDFLEALDRMAPQVRAVLIEIHHARPNDEPAALRDWCERFHLTDLGAPCPWLMEVAAETLAAWRSGILPAGYWDHPAAYGWTEPEQVGEAVMLSRKAPADYNAARIDAMIRELEEQKRRMTVKPRAHSPEHLEWLVRNKVLGETREEIRAGQTVTVEAVKLPISELKTLLALRDRTGRPTRR